MFGTSSQPEWMQLFGVLAAAVAVVGYVVFGWRFGGDLNTLPTMIGVGLAVLVVVWTAYDRI